MYSVVYFDIEVDPTDKKVLDIGALYRDGRTFHSGSRSEFVNFCKGADFLCGHNILSHDLQYLRDEIKELGLSERHFIDTLCLSPLLFPQKPYHKLVKDDKLLPEELNNPVNDSRKALDLFQDEIEKFHQLDNRFKWIICILLSHRREFQGFFRYIGYKPDKEDVIDQISAYFAGRICRNTDLDSFVYENSVELAYCLSLINTEGVHSTTPPWVLKSYPDVDRILHLLRSKPCLEGCEYCNKILDVKSGLKSIFGFDTFRVYEGEPLQERAADAAIRDKSILTVFPTGGGKSLTFQLPALMKGYADRGLTIVISPLQSLMKDQVDNLEKRFSLTEAVTINGLLDPIERTEAIKRVADGTAFLLYISPESLRSRTIERILLGRKIDRFVIDEAHCFSAWGHDFRVDYQYIGDFVKQIREKKGLSRDIPVSCFTATAKQNVIQDIKRYFKEKLDLDLELFATSSTRKNLHYKVMERKTYEEKYNTVRELVDAKNCPAIVYVSRTRDAEQLAERLQKDGYNALAFHGRMDKEVKKENQDAFLSGDVQIMVATSAFGMGVDKDDVGLVIHFTISDSLENYIQEAGRAGRKESISADCYVLYDEEDLSKHFIMLNQTKMHIKEIQQIWKAIKDLTKTRKSLSNSALEIARAAGWDDSVYDIETRVTTAIAALEESGYLRRGQNSPRIFASSILSKNAEEAIERINASGKLNIKQKEYATRIIKSLISSKNRKKATDEAAESRVDYISDRLGIARDQVVRIIGILREEKILADTKDLIAYINKGSAPKRSLSVVSDYTNLERFLLSKLSEEETLFNLKQLNEEAIETGCQNASPARIKTILNYLTIKNWVKQKTQYSSNNHLAVICTESLEILKGKLDKKLELSGFIIRYLYDKTGSNSELKDSNTDKVVVEFSVYELKKSFEESNSIFEQSASAADIEDSLFYLSRIGALDIEGGFLVVYNRLTIDRLEQDNKIRYKEGDYVRLKQFYQQKIEMIHIVGEYAKKLVTDYNEALMFVEDYFQLNYRSFLKKYFKGDKLDDIKRNLTPAKFREIFGELSASQLKIVKDKDSGFIVVKAGPGSGKTKLLVHKLASLLTMEDVKHEQLLMLTFSRAAATEFRTRLMKLIGNAASFIKISTFHSYCFDLLGRVGSIEKSGNVVKEAVENIRSGEVEPNRITIAVLVIDEAQDMDKHEYELVCELIRQNEEMRVIAVGDDDQNIYEFRGSSSRYLGEMSDTPEARNYELVENFRSRSNLVDFSNQFVTSIRERLKRTPIHAHASANGYITVTEYRSANIVLPFSKDILNAELSGTTGVLTKTNEEALQVLGILTKSGVPARLIQSHKNFELHNMRELRSFYDDCKKPGLSTISEKTWSQAKNNLKNKYSESKFFDTCTKLLKTFELTNPKTKYLTDFEVFIRESKLEDFEFEEDDKIMVSTMHKAKGREFDNVFLLLKDCFPTKDEAKRLLYVAMTRAKSSLSVHLNGNYMDHIHVDGMEYKTDENQYDPVERIYLQMDHKMVYLDYYIGKQEAIKSITPGDKLKPHKDGLATLDDVSVVQFSKMFQEDLVNMNGAYELKSAVVEFIVYWYKKEHAREYEILLPLVCLEKE